MPGYAAEMRTRNFLLVVGLTLTAALAGAVGAKLDTRRKLPQLINPLCNDVPCAHFNARLAAIESIIGQQGPEPRYLAIGDSFTEFAEMPVLCGRKPINAGIGYATSKTFATLAKHLADTTKPDFIVLELGTNDALRGDTNGFKDRMTGIVRSLEPLPVIAVPVPPSHRIPSFDRLNAEIGLLPTDHAAPLASVETTDDGVHLKAASYAKWKDAIINATQPICAHLGPARG